jgi:glutaredoxin
MAAAALVACSPPGQEQPEAQAGAQLESPDPSQTRERTAPPRRPERRRDDPSARAQAGEQYKFIDERGQVQLAARLEDIPERQRSTASRLDSPAQQARPGARTDDTRAISNADVTIFTTPSCGYCRAAIAHFEKIGIDYVNRDVQADDEARDEYLELTGGRPGVPVIVVGDAWIQGWSRPEFDRLLATAR